MNTLYPMPVTIEQVAAVIRSMSGAERLRLLELVPDFMERSRRPSTTLSVQSDANTVEQLQQQLLDALRMQPLTPDAPMLGAITVEEYLALSDDARAELWEVWAVDAPALWQEVDVHVDALAAR
jgi:hypothetical protein